MTTVLNMFSLGIVPVFTLAVDIGEISQQVTEFESHTRVDAMYRHSDNKLIERLKAPWPFDLMIFCILAFSMVQRFLNRLELQELNIRAYG